MCFEQHSCNVKFLSRSSLFLSHTWFHKSVLLVFFFFSISGTTTNTHVLKKNNHGRGLAGYIKLWVVIHYTVSKKQAWPSGGVKNCTIRLDRGEKFFLFGSLWTDLVGQFSYLLYDKIFSRGKFSLDFKFRSGHILYLAYIGAKNFEFWPITGFVYFEIKINKSCYWSKFKIFGANVG